MSSTQRTNNLALQYWTQGDTSWHVQMQTDMLALDAAPAIATLQLAPPVADGLTSASLNVRVASGTFFSSTGQQVTYGGSTSYALTANSTNYIWIDDAGAINTNTTGYPTTTPVVRLGTAVTNSTLITTLTPGHVFLQSAGSLRGPLFTTSTAVTVVNTVTETTVLGGVVGTATLPAGVLIAGKSIRVRAHGRLSTTGTPTMNMKVKLGGSVVCSTGAITQGSGVTNTGVFLDALITCRTTGATGTVIANGEVRFGGTTTPMVSTATTTVDTTGTLAIDVTETWGTASTSNTSTIDQVTGEVFA